MTLKNELQDSSAKPKMAIIPEQLLIDTDENTVVATENATLSHFKDNQNGVTCAVFTVVDTNKKQHQLILSKNQLEVRYKELRTKGMAFNETLRTLKIFTEHNEFQSKAVDVVTHDL